jgi:cytochrome c553
MTHLCADHLKAFVRRPQNKRTRYINLRHEKIDSVIACGKHLSIKYFPVLLFLAVLLVHPLLSSDTKAAERAGAILFRDKGCVHCHGADGKGTKKGPDLTGLPKDKLWTPAKITSQILDGGQKMPPFSDSVTDEEAAQLVAYLRSTNKPELPPAPPSKQP